MNTKRQAIYDNFRISQESIDESWTMPYSHCHSAYEIYILKSGTRSVTIDDMTYTTNAKDAVLFSSYIPHKSKGDTPFSGICIHFSERYLDIYFTQEAKKQLMRCFKNKVICLDDSDFEKIKNIADNFNETSENNFLILACILDSLNHSVDSGGADISAINKDYLKKNGKKAQKIIEYTNENYIFIKKINNITELFGVSENYVFQIFRKNYNMTPKQYINKLKIDTVCHRLKYSDKSIKAIAYDCGFDSYEHFINVFKKTIGTTPGEYRKNIRNKT